MGSAKRITDKQERYIQELVKGKSQREAYKIAYDCKRMADKTIDERASVLFNSDKVKARYDLIHDRIIKEAEDECIVTAKQVLRELANIAFANSTDFASVVERNLKNEDGELTEATYKCVDIATTASIDKGKRAAIAGIEQTATGIKVKQHDKVKALELLGRHLSMFTDKQEIQHSGAVSIEQIIKKVEGSEF